MGIVAGRKPRLDERADRGKAGEIRVLRQIADGRARLQEAAAAVRLDLACGDLEKCRLARPVTADKAEPFRRADGQRSTLQQRLVAEGEPYVLEKKKGREGHGDASCSLNRPFD